MNHSIDKKAENVAVGIVLAVILAGIAFGVWVLKRFFEQYQLLDPTTGLLFLTAIVVFLIGTLLVASTVRATAQKLAASTLHVRRLRVYQRLLSGYLGYAPGENNTGAAPEPSPELLLLASPDVLKAEAALRAALEQFGNGDRIPDLETVRALVNAMRADIGSAAVEEDLLSMADQTRASSVNSAGRSPEGDWVRPAC